MQLGARPIGGTAELQGIFSVLPSAPPTGTAPPLPPTTSTGVSQAGGNGAKGAGGGLPTGGGGGRGKPALPIQAKPGNDKYKTEMCRKIIELGFCKYGDKCQFAHTIDELRYASKHRKFKSKACNNWHKNTPGSCRYGNRCCYIHDEDGATLQILREAYGGDSRFPASDPRPFGRQRNRSSGRNRHRRGAQR